MDKHKQAYREEAQDLLNELEAALLELEENPNDLGLVGRVFRAMHTIKGSGAMFGFEDIAEFTHEIETVYDRVRNGGLQVQKDLIGLTLSACDIIKKMVNGTSVEASTKESILKGFRTILCDSQQSETDCLENSPLQTTPPCETTVSDSPKPSVSQGAPSTYRIRFKPSSDIFSTGTNPIRLIEELISFGTHHVSAHTLNIPDIYEINPEACYLFWDIVLTTEEDINAIRDVFIFVEDDCELAIEMIDENESMDPTAAHRLLGEILVERGDISDTDLTAALSHQKKLGEMLRDEGLIDENIVKSALAEQQWVKNVRQTRQEWANSSSIRVAADKLDRLVDLVGELVTVQASLSQKASLDTDPELTAISEQVERLTAELRDNAMGIRMMPIGSTFSKFKRLVRDLSNELGKEVNLITEGGETELDKTVLERLNDPLVHIIRNSIDHGIELPQVREKNGKQRQGTIKLSAVHSGAHVLIKITDDGAGIDPAGIRSKAVEKGFISQDTELSDSEIFSILFTPGFSTAQTVTDVSGRGVGMDVVKRSIDSLRGTIEIISDTGTGTSILMKLPLTLAIIDGLLVEIGHSHFVFPLNSVEECMEMPKKETKNSHHILKVRGEIIPYVSLRNLFGINGYVPEIEQVVIVELDDFRMGFVVDQVIGKHQTVIKNLGKVYRNAKGFSGATILADGSVALILDVNSLSDVAQLEEQHA